MKQKAINLIGSGLLIATVLTIGICAVNHLLPEPQQQHNAGYMDYQIECTQDSIYLFDYGVKVGAIPYDSSRFVNLILNDNK